MPRRCCAISRSIVRTTRMSTASTSPTLRDGRGNERRGDPVNASSMPVVVIVGGGFAGLSAAKALKHAPLHVLLIDRTNHHVFQPLLYQVANCVLSPTQIASPIREVLGRQRNTTVVMG